MSRGTDAGFLALFASPSPNRFPLVDMDAVSGPVYMAGLGFDVDWNGNTYRALHGLGTIEAFRETDAEAAGLVFTLQGVTPEMIALALNSDHSVARRKVAVHLACVIDAATAAELGTTAGLHVAANIWRGFTQPMQIIDGQPYATIRVQAESRIATWLRPRGLLYSDADQQRLHPGDKFFLGWDADAQKQITWPTKEFFKQ